MTKQQGSQRMVDAASVLAKVINGSTGEDPVRGQDESVFSVRARRLAADRHNRIYLALMDFGRACRNMAREEGQ